MHHMKPTIIKIADTDAILMYKNWDNYMHTSYWNRNVILLCADKTSWEHGAVTAEQDYRMCSLLLFPLHSNLYDLHDGTKRALYL